MWSRSFVRICSLLWGHILVVYAFFEMQNYLTDVWGLSFTHAAAILNLWGGICLILPVFFLYLVDEFLGHFRMLVLSSVAFSVGIMLVAVSTPPVLASFTGTCKQYEPNCIGHTQKVLFYIGMSLVAVGKAGHTVSIGPFLEKQNTESDQAREYAGRMQMLGYVIVVALAVAGAIALPRIKPWKIRFAIPAICTALGMFLFLSGFVVYDKERDVKVSPITSVFKVFVASTATMCRKFPFVANHGDKTQESFGHTRSLRHTGKLATETKPDEPENNSIWKEEAKIAVRMIPMWMTFIICGTISSTGNTYFVEQASHMNHKIGKWNVPVQIFVLFSGGANFIFSHCAKVFLSAKNKYLNRVKRPIIGIGFAMVLSILCCITAARIEKMRLGVLGRYGLLEKPDDDIPMSIYWLGFQFFLLVGLDSFLRKSLVAFYGDQAPGSMKDYLDHFTSGVSGLGFMFGVLSVYVVGKISERAGTANWFQFTLSKSRLDMYYWVLAGLSSLNLVIFGLVAWFYRYKECVEDDTVEPEESDGPPDIGEEAKNCGFWF